MIDRPVENDYCSAHMGLPVPTTDGRRLIVKAWYLGGANVVDFTDPTNPVEVAFYDAAPPGPAGQDNWSVYWYKRTPLRRGQPHHLRQRRRPRPRGRAGSRPRLRRLQRRRLSDRRHLRPPQPTDPGAAHRRVEGATDPIAGRPRAGPPVHLAPECGAYRGRTPPGPDRGTGPVGVPGCSRTGPAAPTAATRTGGWHPCHRPSRRPASGRRGGSG
jgi:hypothetical protein